MGFLLLRKEYSIEFYIFKYYRCKNVNNYYFFFLLNNRIFGRIKFKIKNICILSYLFYIIIGIRMF